MEVWSDENGKLEAKVWAEDLDFDTQEQIRNIASMNFIHRHVAVMPDAHLGIGCTIGSVVPTKSAIIPAAVGVDIGCGMMAVKTSLQAHDLPWSLKELRENIERSVPTGKYSHKEVVESGFHFVTGSQFNYFLKQSEPELMFDVKAKRWMTQLGTLGSGNHFIEVCLDENDQVWVMLHSGSRGIGNQIGRKFIELAKEDMRIHHINLPDQNLSYLSEGTQHFDDYWHALEWAQEYASINRRLMMGLVFDQLWRMFPDMLIREEAINCHHNYVAKENHYGDNVYVTRKGAIRARGKDLGIIPGSMGAKSYIVRGKGNQESFHSCSHGAGRKMSRRKAKDTFTSADLEAQTAGVEIRRRKEIIDEIPGAYKDIDRVMELQSDLVEPVHTLKQILCVKGD
jgi:tRNA-splicing ligase RtcB